MGFWEGLAEAMDDIRHQHEIAAYGREVTGDIQLPQQEAQPSNWVETVQEAQTIEPPQAEMER